ncbi:MAG: ATP-binding protein [Deltaproteobacteria bacterium]|nr:ATP-binding protein [Deltaproteobacteria bacterium]
MTPVIPATLDALLRSLKLPSFITDRQDTQARAEREGWSFERFLATLVEAEVSDRRRRRIDRLMRQSGLPADKTLATLKTELLPTAVRRLLPTLCEGGFADRAENLLAFGLPGRGKTHVCAAIGHELVHRGFAVLFLPAFALVQRLLAARRAFELEKALHGLDAYDAIIIDDIGYIQQDRDEMEVLFTFLAERYERRSVIITSNLVFSAWDRIFKDPMTTAAAIDRIVHHAVILEMSGPSVRETEARARLEAVAREPGA